MKMNTIDNYIKIYRDLLDEYLKIYNPLAPAINEEKVAALSRKLDDFHDDFESEYKYALIQFLDNPQKLRAFLLDLYVNGFMRFLCVLDRFVQEHIKGKDSLKELDIRFVNFRHGVNFICNEIKEYLSLNLKLAVSDIDCEGYNVSGNYFKDFELEPPVSDSQFSVSENQTANKTKNKYSYHWHGKNKLEDVWETIKCFFHDSTSFLEFKSVFSKTKINSDFQPIKWYNNNASEILYFIIKMMDEELIPKQNRMDYTVLRSCFLDDKGNPFDADFKSLKQKLDYNLGDIKKQNINKVLSDFC